MPGSCTSCAILYVVFASTVNLWKTLYQYQSVQRPNFAGLEEYVFTCFERMYRAYDAQRDLLTPERLYEVRYEDLVQDRSARCVRLYDRLGLGGFEAVLPQARGVPDRDPRLQDQQVRRRSRDASPDRPPLGTLHAALRLLYAGAGGRPRNHRVKPGSWPG